jgi:predicted GTPase
VSQKHCVYVLVVSLARDTDIQLNYWMNFLANYVDMEDSSVIIVGSKADQLPKATYNTEIEKFSDLVTKKYRLNPPQIVSAVDLRGIKELLAKIQWEAQKHCKIKLPSTVLQMRKSLEVRKLHFVWTQLGKSEPLKLFHRIGEIVFLPTPGMTLT